jgi:hypothetical protein
MTYRTHVYSLTVTVTAGIFWLLIFGYGARVTAQNAADFPSRTDQFVVTPEQNQMRLDLLTIDYSIRVFHADTLISHNYLAFDRNTGMLTFFWPRHWSSLPTELTVHWQYRPLRLQRQFSLMDSDQALQAGRHLSEQSTIARTISPSNTNTGTSPTQSGLQTNGSISRGIIVGSNRDLGLESGMRFDLQGYITEDVYITASLSDQNTLIQPDGTTQNLREFDQVFIRLDAPRTRIQLGDVDARFSGSRIAQLNRRLQGGEGQYLMGDGSIIKAAAAVIRGTFRVMTFNGREGVQGPYRLTGNSNETFIMVVAGTEQVYLDGRLLQRGEDLDYTIDYSSGELFFTTRRIIRGLHRIRVEYQYISNSYARTLLAAEADEAQLAGGRISVGVTFLRQSDAIRPEESTGLSEMERNVLSLAGSNTDLMRVSGAEFTGFRSDAPWVLYARIDTVINGKTVSIYENRPGDISGVYRVRFSRVGEARGSYRRASRSINGIVYEWVGEGLGDYEPFRQLHAPESMQILSLRSSVAITDQIQASAEWGVSQFEANRFSSGGAAVNDHMFLSRVQGSQWRPGAGRLRLDTYALHEYQGKNFRFFDRVRDVEFERNWDLQPGFASEVNRTEAGIKILADDTIIGEYRYQRLQTNLNSGFRNDVNIRLEVPGLPDADFRSGMLHSSDSEAGTDTRWFVLGGEAGYDMSFKTGIRLRPLYTVDTELRKEFAQGTDSLRAGSFRYSEHIPGLAATGSSWSVQFQYSYRQDFEVLMGKLQRSYTSTSPGIQAQFESGGFISSTNRIAWRNQQSTELFAREAGRSDVRGLALRSNSDLRFLNRFAEVSILYDVSTESRALLQETYLEVGPEFGQYVWEDLNGDGIQQVDEFFPEQNPGEGTYIKQLIPTDELFPVAALQFRYRMRLDLSRLDALEAFDGVVSGWLRGLQYTGTMDIREQNESERRRDLYLLRSDALLDAENTLSGRIQQTHELAMFRNISTSDLRLRMDNEKSLNRLAAGLDEVKRSERVVEGRQLIDLEWAIEAMARRLHRNNTNTELASRNFDITGWELGPSVVRTNPGTSRYALRTVYGIRADDFPAMKVSAVVVRISAEALLEITDGFQGALRVEQRRMSVDGASTAAGIFELTDGAGIGNTWLWNFQLQWRSQANFRAVFNYDGRTTAQGSVIQTFRMSVSAVF